VPDEPVPDDAAGLRAANARLRAVVEAGGAEIEALCAELDAERKLRRRQELRLAGLERRLGMDSQGWAGTLARIRGRARIRPRSAVPAGRPWTVPGLPARGGRRSSTWSSSGR
jgi:hypothetical protein